jgi:solute:Na+ symporter, SSS family
MAMNTWFNGTSHITWPDILVLVGLLTLMFGLAYWMGGAQKNTQDFFLARRKIPGWAACLSFVAAEVSALTIISVPATAFMENWAYAQFFIGSTLARFTIAYLFIPAFYQYNCTTIYEFLKYRFGAGTQYTGTVFFFITRLLGSGVRLTAASLAVSVLLGWKIAPAIAFFTIIGIAYTIYGGIKAVVWTGLFQALVFIFGGLVAIGYLLGHIRGGWIGFVQAASTAGKLRVWDWGPPLSDPQFFRHFMKDPNIIWMALLNGYFGSMAAFGTDHELMQRLLTVETRRESQKSMVWTTFWSGLVLMTYLTVGACLYVFYKENPSLSLPEKLDAIFPYFIGNSMPVGLRGLLLGAIVMAGVHSPLASLTASFVTDIYRPLIKKDGDDAHYLLVSRISVGLFAAALAFLAYAFSFFQKILWLAFKIGGITFGSLLGVFLLGLLTTRRSNRANIFGMILMGVINATLLTLSETHVLNIAWTWLVLIGTAGTFAIGWVFGPRMEEATEGSYAN